MPRIIIFWHKGSAWIAGPLLIGLIAVFFAAESEHAAKLNRLLSAAFPLAPLFIMPAGFALISYLSTRYFPGVSGSGIPQTIAALEESSPAKKNHLLSLHIVVGKLALALAGLSIGASAGREGPTVQLGASIMHAFYGRGPFQGLEQRRILILAGGAAGIAAAFNTPLAGIMFAIEELSKKHVFNANSSTLITVVLSGLISLYLLGNYTYFGSTGAYLDWQYGAAAVLLCGIIGGTAGGLFSRALIAASCRLPARWAEFARNRPFAFAAACGLAVAVLGVLTGGLVFGTGYQPTRMTLEDHGPLPWYFGIAKLLATLLTAASGIPGGIFAPSLSVGAGIGDNVAMLFPALAPHSAIILLVMAAYLSGVTRGPMTAFIITMEMTDTHQMLLPLMAASVVACGISKFISPVPLYQALAEKFSTPGAAAVPASAAASGRQIPPQGKRSDV